MGNIASKLAYLDETKSEIKMAIESKDVTIPDDAPFSDYPAYLDDVGGEPVALDEIVAEPSDEDVEITPGSDYVGIAEVYIRKEKNLRPENIRAGVTIFGVTGTMVVKDNTGGGNGVKLPALPDWDKEAYPYAYVLYVDLAEDTESMSGYAANLVVLNVRAIHDDSTDRELSIYGPRDGESYICTNNAVIMESTNGIISALDTWFYTESLNIQREDAYLHFTEHCIWANIDVLNTDGTVYFAASDSVPIK